MDVIGISCMKNVYEIVEFIEKYTLKSQICVQNKRFTKLAAFCLLAMNTTFRNLKSLTKHMQLLK